jgi:hypothetical protein
MKNEIKELKTKLTKMLNNLENKKELSREEVLELSKDSKEAHKLAFNIEIREYQLEDGTPGCFGLYDMGSEPTRLNCELYCERAKACNKAS